MKRLLIFLLSLFLLLLSVPALAADDPPVSATDIYSDAAGEGLNEQVYSELLQLRAYTEYIFWGVIALSGVVLGSFVGITLIRMWGA